MSNTLNENKDRIKKISEWIKDLKNSELSDLLEILKKDFNISETSLAQGLEEKVEGNKEEKQEEKKNNCSVFVTKMPEETGKQIKIYSVASKLIKDSGKEINIIGVKKIIENNQAILENVSRDEANVASGKLEAEGATVAIK